MIIRASGPLLLRLLDAPLPFAALQFRSLASICHASNSFAPLSGPGQVAPSAQASTIGDLGEGPISPLSYHTLPQPLLPPPPAMLRWHQHWQQWWAKAAPGQQQLQQQRGIKSKVLVDYQVRKEPLRDTYTGEPKNYIQLLCALKYAPSIARLQELVDNHANRFDAPHVSAALTRLPKVARYRDADMERFAIIGAASSVEDAAKAGAHTRLRPVQGARARRAYREAAAPLAAQLLQMVLGTGSLPQAPLLASSTAKPPTPVPKRILKGLIHSFTTRNAANCVWALGALQQHGVQVPSHLKAKAVESMLAVMAGRCGKRAEPVDARARCLDAAQLVCGLSKLQLWPRKPWGHKLLLDLGAHSARNTQHLMARDIQMALHGYMLLGYAPRFLVDAMAERIMQLPRDFVPQGISTLMRLLAPRFRPLAALPSAVPAPAPLLPLGPAGTGQLPAALREPRVGALRCLAEGVAPQIVSVTPMDLAGLALAVSGLGAAYRRHSAPAVLEHPNTTTTTTTSDAATTTTTSTATTDSSGGGSSCSVGEGGADVSGGSVAAQVAPGVPEWLASLARTLCGKAVQQLQELQPMQLGAVLDMVAVLGMRDVALLRAVADGVLAEPRVDASLPVPAAASLVRAFAALGMLEPSGAADVQQWVASHKLSDLAAAAALQPPLTPITMLPSAPRVRGDGHGAPESTLLHELRGAPMAVRAAAAVERVLSAYTARGAVEAMGAPDVAALTGALAAMHTAGVSSSSSAQGALLEALRTRAELLLLPPPAADADALDVQGGTQPLAAAGAPALLEGPVAGSSSSAAQQEGGTGRVAGAGGVAGEQVAQGEAAARGALVGGAGGQVGSAAAGDEGEDEDGDEEEDEILGGGVGRRRVGAKASFEGPPLVHTLRALNAMGACSTQLAVAALHSARSMLAGNPCALPTAVEVVCEAEAGGAPADAHSAGMLAQAFMNSMAAAHNLASTEVGLATPYMRWMAGDTEEGAGAPSLSIPQLGQMLAYIDRAGFTHSEFLEAAAEQLLLQLPTPSDSGAAASGGPGMLQQAAGKRHAAPAVARALVQCLRVYLQPEKDAQPSGSRQPAAVHAMHHALLHQGLLPFLNATELEEVMDGAQASGQAHELVAACEQLLEQQQS